MTTELEEAPELTADPISREEICDIVKGFKFEIQGVDGNGKPKNVLVEGFEGRNKVVLANMRWVYKIAAKYANSKFTLADCVQQGTLGLIHAIETFDPEARTPAGTPIAFLTHATSWIRQAICRAQENLGLLPSQSQNAVRYLKQAGGNADTQYDEEEIERVIENLKGPRFNKTRGFQWTKEKVKEVAKKATLRSVPISEARHVQRNPVVIDERLEKIAGAMAGLSPRSREVIRLRFFEDKNLPQIGEIMGISRERVRQIEAVALADIRNSFGPPEEI